MVKLYDGGVFLLNGAELVPAAEAPRVAQERGVELDADDARTGTIAWGILEEHNTSGDPAHLKIRFDAMASHDITYVGIVQTAKASGMERFPLPYVLTNCHNSLCAVGGTINEDDHVFGLSAAKHYGGIYVPPHIAVIHQYMREMMAGCGKMILGSDSHTRYGALGTMAVGEGGGELVKQLLLDTYDVDLPQVVAVYLTGAPRPGVGPQDVALAIIRAVFSCGYVKNKVMEFVGPGVASLPTDYRNGVDVMTTETTCLSSVWVTDDDTRGWLALHGRAADYRRLAPADVAYYDGCVYVDLSSVEPMIALPFHPSNAYTIAELQENLEDILRETEKKAEKVGDGRATLSLLDKVVDGQLHVQQAVIAGCAGGNYSNVMNAAAALRGKSCGDGDFMLSVYPSSQAVNLELTKKGAAFDLMAAGAIYRTAFCGPCFGAGDTPQNNGLSIRHTTRNFPNREGSKPGNGQLSGVALMDARSIAATAANGGVLTSALELDCWDERPPYEFDRSAYDARVYDGFGHPEPEDPLVYGPNIKDWPAMEPLADDILLRVCSKIMDEVTTTDELIPSGETSSYRSNPLGLAEFTLSRRDPGYVGRSKEVRSVEEARAAGKDVLAAEPELAGVYDALRAACGRPDLDPQAVEFGSVVYAVKPGDGSAREQAASCQRVLGGLANIVREYATKRYRSNVMNWGMVPFQLQGEPPFEVGDYVFVPGVRAALDGDLSDIPAWLVRVGEGGATDGAAEGGANGEAPGAIVREIHLYVAPMTPEERAIVKAGCLINFNRAKATKAAGAQEA